MLNPNTETPLAPNRDEIVRGLCVIRPKGAVQLVAIDPMEKLGIQAQSFNMPGEAEDACEWAAQRNAGGLNLYFTVNMTLATYKKAGKKEMLQAVAMWADCDPNVFKHKTYAAARSYLLETLLPALEQHASYIIDSGNGLSPFFVLEHPLDIEGDHDGYEAINSSVGKFWEGPSAFNCDRVMRLPGTVNYPNAAKLKKGYPETPGMARMLFVSDRKYLLSQIEDMITPKDGLRDRFKDYLAGHPRVAARYAGDKSGMTDTTGSAMDMSMVSMLKMAGFTKNECRALLQDWKHGSASKDRDSDRYWDRCYERADEGRSAIPKIDTAALLATVRKQPHAVEYQEPLPFPAHLLRAPGMLGTAVQWMVSCATKPQPVLALASVITLFGMALAQRVCTQTGLRTNFYAVGVGPTSAGKDHARKCNKIAAAFAGIDDRLGGEELASVQGLLARVAKVPTTMFQIDEFGLFLQAITSHGAGSHLKQLMSGLMKLFSSTGTKIMGAEYADQAGRPRIDIDHPCVNLHGTTTPETLFEAFTGADVTSGSLNRILFFFAPERKDNWPMQFNEMTRPPEEIVAWLRAASIMTGMGMEGRSPDCPIKVMMNRDAQQRFELLFDHQQNRERETKSVGTDGMYGRLWEHAAKLAMLAACARYDTAEGLTTAAANGQIHINDDDAAWGIELACYLVERMAHEVSCRVADSEFGRDKQNVLSFIEKAGSNGVTERELSRACRKFSGMNPLQRQAILGALAAEESIGRVDFAPPSGRGKHRVAIVSTAYYQDANEVIDHAD